MRFSTQNQRFGLHHQTKNRKTKGSFSERERGKERESERVTKRKRESDEIQVVVVVCKKYTQKGGVVTLETHSNVTYDDD